MAKKLADLAGPTPYPGETPEAQDAHGLEDKSMQMPGPDGVRPDYTVAPERPADEYNWAMSGTHVMVSEDHHGAQFQALQWSDFARPHAYGRLELFYNWTAYWHVFYTNLSPHIVEKRLKKYTRDQGWEWGGLLDEDGVPNQSRAIRQSSVPGIGDINPGLKDWKRDEWSGTDMYDNPADHQVDYYGEQDPENDETLRGLYTCSECGAPCMGHEDLRNHIMRVHVNPTRKPPQDPQPVVDLDDVLPANFNEAVMDQTRNRMAHLLFHLSARPDRPEPKNLPWWKSNRELDLPYEMARQVLRKADQALIPQQGNMDLFGFHKFIGENVHKPLIEAWQNLPREPFFHPANTPEENADRYYFYRTMDPEGMWDRTDMLWGWRDEWKNRLLHHWVQKPQLDADKLQSWLDQIDQAYQSGEEAKAKDLAIEADKYVAQSLSEFNIWKNQVYYAGEWNEYDGDNTKKRHRELLGDAFDLYSLLFHVLHPYYGFSQKSIPYIQGLIDQLRKLPTVERTRDMPPSWMPRTAGLNGELPAGVRFEVVDNDPEVEWRDDERLAASTVKPNIPGPIPFVYDIESDRIYVGHPGERHSDIQGRFTPGGIVEGLYDPKGNVQIRTDTDMPYTIRHMAELWYALHPELEIRGIFLLQGQKKYRLASANIGHQVRSLVAADPAAWAAYEALEPHGNVYAVGGVVRDVVLGKTPKDVDLMVQGMEPEEVEDVLRQLPGRVDLTGESFGVFRYRDPEGNEVEIALPRTERSTGPGHRDFEVITDPYISVGEDLARRDFTGNAMAVNLTTGDLVDPYRGSEDLKSRVLRTVSDCSFVEDPLRILRAFSSVSRHGLALDPQTHRDLEEHAPTLKELPQERLQMELDKIMAGNDPARAIELMEQTGVLHHVLPDVAATIGFDQKNPHHAHTLNEHLREVLDQTCKLTSDLDVRWAAILHDIGKPVSQWVDEQGVGHYYRNEQGQGQQHEEVGADQARKLLTALKFPTDRIDRICHLISHHMFPAFSTQGGARKFINRVGDEHVNDLLTLRLADMGGKGVEGEQNVPLMHQYVRKVREAGEPTALSMLAINGNDLIGIGIPPGPQMGQILKHLLNLVIEDPALNDKATLLTLAQQSQSIGLDEPKLSHVTVTANILDPIQSELDPAVFNNADSIEPTVKPKIVEWVKKKVYTTMMDNGWPDPSDYLSMMLTGSLTTYQWSQESDFDISLWIDAERLPEYVRWDLISMMIEHCDGTIVPGTTHPLQCFVVDVTKFKKEDLYKPGVRSAYDLDQSEWFVLPERERSIDVSKKWPEHIRYAQGVVDKMKILLRYGDADAARVYYKFLHEQRRRDMIAGKGDYAVSNIVYKMIMNEGLVPEITALTGMYIA